MFLYLYGTRVKIKTLWRGERKRSPNSRSPTTYYHLYIPTVSFITFHYWLVPWQCFVLESSSAGILMLWVHYHEWSKSPTILQLSRFCGGATEVPAFSLILRTIYHWSGGKSRSSASSPKVARKLRHWLVLHHLRCFPPRRTLRRRPSRERRHRRSRYRACWGEKRRRRCSRQTFCGARLSPARKSWSPGSKGECCSRDLNSQKVKMQLRPTENGIRGRDKARGKWWNSLPEIR